MPLGVPAPTEGHLRPEYVCRLAREWPGTPGHAVVDGTLVLSDLSGFTHLSERMARLGRHGAEVLTDTVSAVFDDLVRTVDDAGGDVGFAGDALLAPFRDERHEERACGAAARMLRTITRRDAVQTGPDGTRVVPAHRRGDDRAHRRTPPASVVRERRRVVRSLGMLAPALPIGPGGALWLPPDWTAPAGDDVPVDARSHDDRFAVGSPPDVSSEPPGAR